METRTHTFICEGLKVSCSRVDQWIARRIMELETESSQGKTRAWTKLDAIKLVTLIYLSDAGLPLEPIARLLDGLRGFTDDVAFFVIFYGPHHLIKTSRRGDAPSREEDCTPVYMPGAEWLQHELIRKRDLIKFITRDDVRVSIVISLGAIENRIEQLWNQSE